MSFNQAPRFQYHAITTAYTHTHAERFLHNKYDLYVICLGQDRVSQSGSKFMCMFILCHENESQTKAKKKERNAEANCDEKNMMTLYDVCMLIALRFN